ncbi:hypothetical protein [Deinococcus sp.]|uniref:hypothetical protein n=1 Tax=Deinococcus sp. TaxID=47478 RepID=UPI003B5A311A
MSKPPAPPSAAPSAVRLPTVASNVPEVSVDVKQLADRVYRLLLNDLSLQARRNSGERK